MTTPLSTPADRKAALERAEKILGPDSEMGPPRSFTVYESCIRDLCLELSVLDGLYTILHEAYMNLGDELATIRATLAEDLPKGYMTHRLYALLYPLEELEEMAK